MSNTKISKIPTWYIYILKCNDGSFYTGSTNDLVKRLAAHNAGKGGKYTRAHLPVELLYSEKLADHSSALKREHAIKKLNKEKKLLLVDKK